MNHFRPKSLLFYGTMIGSVAILFKGVSWYGEKNLKAPANFTGQYISETPLPGCAENTRFALTIQQSGIYLYGTLQVIEASTEAADTASQQTDLTLRGTLEKPSSENLTLVGTIKLPATCHATAEKNSSNSQGVPVTIQGSVLKTGKAHEKGNETENASAKFIGKLTLDSFNPSEFTAIQEISKTQQNSGH